jgi:hypothetical protein
MSDISSMLKTMDLGGLLADGLREATRQAPVAWEAPAPEDLAGLLPRYEVLRLIGRGGMGAVYEARQIDLGRRVALKILPPELGADEAFAERFRREARALGRLAHGNILEVFEFGESAAGHLFFSMQYVEGGDLGSRLKSGPLPLPDALRMVKEICAALEAAHAEGIIHRDIKPSNILLTADGTVKVADFGLAVLDDQPKERLTYTGIAVGTMEYAAPEQAAGTAVDTRSDLYSVGVICYEVLTGQLPRGIFDPPSKVNGAVHPAMDSVVHTAMQSDPARRYQSATDFRVALNRTAETPERSVRWRAPAIAAVVLLGAGAAVYHWWPAKAATAPQRIAPVSEPVTGSTIVSWGQNEFGEGNAPANLGSVQALAAGDGFTVALKSDGTVAAWGHNHGGQTNVPAGLTGVRAIAAGGYHALALKSDGTVVAWGANNEGQSSVPAGLSGVQAITAGNAYSAALKDDGTIALWGAGSGLRVDDIVRQTGLKAIAAGQHHLLAVKRDGTVLAWGDPGQGRTKVPAGLTGVRTVAAHWFHSVALKEDGTVVVWGANDSEQKAFTKDLSGVQAIAAGLDHTMILKSDGTVIAWSLTGGAGKEGQATVPAGLTGVKAIAAGFRHSVVAK